MRERVGAESGHELLGNRLADRLMRRCVLVGCESGTERDDGNHALVGLRIHLNS